MARPFLSYFEGAYYRFDGEPYLRSAVAESRLAALRDYSDIRPEDVILWAYPKSGTHFVRDIVRKIVLDGDIDKAVKEACDCWLEGTIPDVLIFNRTVKTPMTLDDISAMASPRIPGSHLHYSALPQKVQNGKCKVIYISRNPKDVIVSHFEMSNTLLKSMGLAEIPWHTFLEASIEGEVFFGSWFRHIKDFLAVNGRPHILWVKFEDLKKDLRGQVKRICDFLNKDLPCDTIDRIAESCVFDAARKQYPTSLYLRKGDVGGWKDYFTVAQSDAFDERFTRELGGLLTL